MEIDLQDRYLGCLFGLACGDAVGTTTEFKVRGTFALVDDMVGGGTFGLAAGQWTDDTSMALCLAASLTECRCFDARDQMQRYVRWMRDGYYSSTGACFDIGGTVSTALYEFERSGEPFSGPTHPRSAGNGSIMRLAPVPMWYNDNLSDVLYYAAESSRTTHGTTECIDACVLFGGLLHQALSGCTKHRILADPFYGLGSPPSLVPKIVDIANGAYMAKEESQIRGSGYVVESLEAALWCFHRTDNYRAAILLATNLGDDADTTAAVCGQIAGAHYGIQGIPPEWRARVAMSDEIQRLALALLERNSN